MLEIFLLNEERRYKHPLYSFKIIPMSYEELIKNYNVYEFTEHWYDSSPKECYVCKYSKYCDKCVYYKKWKGSLDQLSFNNWIDVWGPGIWSQTQEDVNNLVKEIFENEILKDKECEKRLFWYQPLDKRNYFYLFYLNRDRTNEDYWFVFKKRGTSLK